MSTDSGYVDISALYGLEGKVLLVGEKGLVIGGKALIVKSMGSWITKRFSVSKAKDGKIGLSYDLGLVRRSSGNRKMIKHLSRQM